MRDTIEMAKDGIFWITPEGEILYGNKTVREMLGYNQKELQNLSISDIDPHFKDEKRKEIWKKLKKEGSMTFETEEESKDGTIFRVEINSNYVRHNDRELEFAFVRRIDD